MPNLVTGDIIAKTRGQQIPVASDSDKEWLRDSALGQWVNGYFVDVTPGNAVGLFLFFRAPYACTVKEVLIAGQTVAADNTDYATITVSALTAGVARTAASGDTRAASLNGLTASVPKALTLSTTQANLELAAGDCLGMAVAKAGGTGKALTAALTAAGGQGTIFVRLERKYA